MNTILAIQDLCVRFNLNNINIPVINGVSFNIQKGKILALVGESGCGKTMTALSILRLVPEPGKITEGKIIFNDKNLLELKESEMQKIRGKEISLIFQEPGLALNPVYSIGNQIGEAIKIHRKEITSPSPTPLPPGERVKMRGNKIKQEVIRLLNLVKIPNPEQRIRSYPHELSGGMQQRALIAMAIACEPKLLIADEPTTALDVTVQAQILLLIKELTEKLNMSVLLITHDLGIVAEIADHVAVMYAGKIVEYTDVYKLFKNPMHPYTKGLMASIPRLGNSKNTLSSIPGRVPDLTQLPSGCTFNPRCDLSKDQCKTKEPKLLELSPDHWASCDIIKN